MSDFEKLSALMKADWNRRLRHDYRFWMSDGVSDDRVMWESGARDFEILCEGIPFSGQESFLELGCGVGRLLAPALKKCGRVIGVDVSEEAIKKAAELLPTDSRLQLIAGNGYNLSEVQSGSIDLAVSFAAITSMPTDVIANYLVELYRILKPEGCMRLQIYLGEEQQLAHADTLHLRCFQPENFKKGLEAAGFDIEWIKELVLPFQVSFKEHGLETFIASFRKSNRSPLHPNEISRLLLPLGESETEGNQPISPIEFWMSYNYAKTLLEAGDIEKAREAVGFASDVCKATAIDVSDLLQEIISEINKKEAEQAKPKELSVRASFDGSSEIFEKNLKALKGAFPELAAQLEDKCDEAAPEIQQTEEGPILVLRGQCLDHPVKPQTSAEVWAKRSLAESRLSSAEHIVVYGFGSGYHISSLLSASSKKISVIEPSLAVFRVAMGLNDLTAVFPRLNTLSVGSSSVPKIFDEESEIIVRPQTQTLSLDYLNKIKATFYGKRGIATLLPTVGVLGPLQGGTLPIAGYTARALEVLRQRTRRYDVSGFAPGYHLFDGFVKEKITQGLLQNRYVEMISNVILQSLIEKPIDILVCMAQAPVTPALLTELRKMGIITVLWFVEDYLRFTYWQHMAQYYDYVFTIQKGQCLELIKKAGAAEVHYLPCACDPAVHATIELTSEEKAFWGSPVSFVGAGYHNRQQTFASLAEMPFKIWGTEWPTCSPFDRLVQAEGKRLSPEEYVKIFNSTDVNINLHSSDERDGVDPYGDFVNPRTFELASCGAFQLCDSRSLLPELFEAGKEIVTFDSVRELKDKIDYYIAHPEERLPIVQAAKERVLLEHTYAHRIKEMLSVIYSTRYEHLKNRIGISPWKKMLERSKAHPELYSRCLAAYERGEAPILDGLVSDIMGGGGTLSETEQKLLFLFHVRKQIIRMKASEAGLQP